MPLEGVQTVASRNGNEPLAPTTTLPLSLTAKANACAKPNPSVPSPRRASLRSLRVAGAGEVGAFADLLPAGAPESTPIGCTPVAAVQRHASLPLTVL